MVELKLTKGENTRKKILAGAMRVLSEHGEHGMTFQKIARACGVSQPLVVHYFKTRDQIFPELLQYMMDVSLQLTENALQESREPLAQLEMYFSVSIEFIRSQPEMAHFYMTFYYLSCFDQRVRAVNDQLRAEATARIAKILTTGIDAGCFQIQGFNGDRIKGTEATAKMIHNLLTGTILNLISEGMPVYSDQTLIRVLREFCQRELSAKTF